MDDNIIFAEPLDDSKDEAKKYVMAMYGQTLLDFVLAMERARVNNTSINLQTREDEEETLSVNTIND